SCCSSASRQSSVCCFNVPATTEICTLSLHDALPISVPRTRTIVYDVTDLDDPVVLTEYLGTNSASDHNLYVRGRYMFESNYVSRSEEHTSELQSRENLVCRLLLEKKKETRTGCHQEE